MFSVIPAKAGIQFFLLMLLVKKQKQDQYGFPLDSR